jgi:hypothetical protein
MGIDTPTVCRYYPATQELGSRWGISCFSPFADRFETTVSFAADFRNECGFSPLRVKCVRIRHSEFLGKPAGSTNTKETQ